ncbi:hypothetical protein [Chitinophaga sp.]|uniref:hypothetical protein n=1 Tax=Chitinophaga sp. TaxID=1869181 RepID=UPI0031D42EFF
MMKKTVSILCVCLALLAACSKTDGPGADGQNDDPADVVREPVPFDQLPSVSRTFDVPGTVTHVNVMDNKRSVLPAFRKLNVKSNTLRGYMKDVYGRPLPGAEIGVRSSLVGGAYTSAVAQSDQSGYYEVVLPVGSADIFKAGCTIDYQNGRAPISLFPADSNLTHFVSTAGAVKNFVLLPYGRRHPDDVSESPWWSSNYLGGSVHISYNIRTQSLPLPGSIPAGAVIVVKLTPEALFHADEKVTFVVRKTVENNGFYINNIPLGRYHMEVGLENGPALQLEESINLRPEFGMSPKKVTGSCSVTFIPGDGDVLPWYGNWKTVPVNASIPE